MKTRKIFNFRPNNYQKEELSPFLLAKLKSNLIFVDFPSHIKVTYKSIYGLEKEKEVLSDIPSFFDVKSKVTQPHMSYFISGPVGVGKASLVFATAKEADIPVISCDSSIFVMGNEEKSVPVKINLIFNTARILEKRFGGVIIAFKNAHEIQSMENDIIFYSHLIQENKETRNTFLFMLSASDEMEVPALIYEDGMFNTILSVDYPDLKTREKIFKDYLKRTNTKVAQDVSINRLAKDTIGSTPLEISYIIKDAKLYSLRQKHNAITKEDFAETIDRYFNGEKHNKMTEKERKMTAYHEAGHVVTAYYSNPEYVLKRVEISPRSSGSLGLTQNDVDESKYSYFKEDYENMIVEFLGGYAAEELIYGSHTSGVVTDLTYATTYAANMVRAYGMDDENGPLVVITKVTDSEKTQEMVDNYVRATIKKMLIRAKTILTLHRASLDALTAKLLEKEVVSGEEIKELFEKAEVQHGLVDVHQKS